MNKEQFLDTLNLDNNVSPSEVNVAYQSKIAELQFKGVRLETRLILTTDRFFI